MNPGNNEWLVNTVKNFLAALILALSLIGCSSSKEEHAKSEEQREQLYNAVNQPLEQAKGVEKQVFESAEQQKKRLDGL